MRSAATSSTIVFPMPIDLMRPMIDALGGAAAERSAGGGGSSAGSPERRLDGQAHGELEPGPSRGVSDGEREPQPAELEDEPSV